MIRIERAAVRTAATQTHTAGSVVFIAASTGSPAV